MNNLDPGTIPFEHLTPNMLDRFISAWIEDNLEDALYKVIAQRGGSDVDWDFREKLSNKWHEENGYDKDPEEGDVVRYSEDTPEYVWQGRGVGYVKGKNSGRWVKVGE